MRYVNLGKLGIKSSVIGPGCMGMSEFYGPTDDDESRPMLAKPLELGVTMFDTADLELTADELTLITSVLATEKIAGSRDWVPVAKDPS